MSDTATLEEAKVDLDVLAAKLAEKLKPQVPQPEYELLAFTIVGKELRATVRTPSGEVYQGIVGEWQKVQVVEVPK